MREILRLVVLFLFLGFALGLASFLVENLGLAGSGPIQTAEQALALSAGNALLLAIGFGGAGLLYFLFILKDWKLFQSAGAQKKFYGWIALLMLGLFLVLPWLSLDAQSFRLPPQWQALEHFLEAQEAHIEGLMRGLITHGHLLYLLLFMAVAPGVFEEIFFRGAFQSQVARLVNPHAAIWITATIFSLIHFQVYGFFARLLLGAVMGYLVWATQSLWPAIWAHFLNNAYATLVAYVGLHFLGHPEWIDSTYRPPLWAAGLGLALAGLAGYQLYRLERG
ncbi:MAG: CPBP family intramembrane metalloprotease [Bacteroidia bacterium]|nr:CPBP family intramembrane metalloprotease [Bacteroidia bacterium]MDW8088903.1 CPBP family intramembrane glutamic endopeptidase [Bacteroidia bacterium]